MEERQRWNGAVRFVVVQQRSGSRQLGRTGGYSGCGPAGAGGRMTPSRAGRHSGGPENWRIVDVAAEVVVVRGGLALGREKGRGGRGAKKEEEEEEEGFRVPSMVWAGTGRGHTGTHRVGRQVPGTPAARTAARESPQKEAKQN